MALSMGKVLGSAVMGGLAAGVVNLLIAVGASAAGAPLIGSVQGPGTPAIEIPVFMPLVASVVPAIGAWAVWAGLSKVTAAHVNIFVGVAVVFGLLSMGGPATLENATTTTKLILGLMHVVAGVGITAGILRAVKGGS